MILAKQSSIVAFIFLIGMFHSYDDVVAQESQQPDTVHSATQEAITVHLEKVAVDRILNTSAWLKAKEEESKHGKEIAGELRQHLPARLV